jgi:hypothetical protein
MALDAVAKISGVIVAASALVGITYNVAFFMGSKQSWLFHLSVTDNLTATLYALPFVVIVALMMVLSVFIGAVFYSEPPPRRGAAAVCAAVVHATIPLITFGFSVLALRYALPKQSIWEIAMWSSLGAALGYLPGIAWNLLRGRTVRWIKNEARLTLAIAMVATPLVVSVGFHARGVRDDVANGTEWVEVEIADKNILQGKPVRVLEGGVILARGGQWIWIPRTEIKRVTEVAEPK